MWRKEILGCVQKQGSGWWRVERPTSQFHLVRVTMFLVSTIVCTAILHDDEIACLNFVTAWSRQQGRRSVKGPDTFRLSSFVVGSNVRVIVSLGLARKYIYGREICLLSVGPQSLEEPGDRIVSRKYDPTASPLLQLDMGPVTVKSPGSSSRFGQLPGWRCQ